MPIQSKQQPPYYQQGTNVKIYKALLTQTGTNAPTAEILQNTIGTIIWTYNDVGSYNGTLTGAFPEEKTLAIPGNQGAIVQITVTTDQLQIYTLDTTYTQANGWLNKTPILIEVHTQI